MLARFARTAVLKRQTAEHNTDDATMDHGTLFLEKNSHILMENDSYETR